MADYCWVYGVIHFTSPAGWLPVHRDQLRAQRSSTSLGKLYLFTLKMATVLWQQILWRHFTSRIILSFSNFWLKTQVDTKQSLFAPRDESTIYSRNLFGIPSTPKLTVSPRRLFLAATIHYKYIAESLLMENKHSIVFVMKQSKGCKFMPKMHQNKNNWISLNVFIEHWLVTNWQRNTTSQQVSR